MSIGGFDLLQPAGTPFVFGFGNSGVRQVLAAGMQPDMVAQLLADPTDGSSSIMDHQRLGAFVRENLGASGLTAGMTAQITTTIRSMLFGMVDDFADQVDQEVGDVMEKVAGRLDPNMINEFFQGITASGFECLPNSFKIHYRTR